MQFFRKVLEPHNVLAKEVCNCCGAERNAADWGSYTDIVHLYGYGSTKDGSKYVSHVCEDCMDKFYTTFKIPPQVVGSLIIGEDPGMPTLYLDEHPEVTVRAVLRKGAWPINDAVSALRQLGIEEPARLLRKLLEEGTLTLNEDMRLKMV